MPRVFNGAVLMTINEVDNRYDIYYQSKREAKNAILAFAATGKANQFSGADIIYLRDGIGHYRTIETISLV